MTADGAGSGGDVDLAPELRTEIRDFASRLLEMDYYDVLGVGRGDEAAAIRDAFFERSKKFHPDRYFKRELGPFRQLLHEIYKRVVAAHDVLRDAKMRAAYDKTLGPAPATSKPLAEPAFEEPEIHEDPVTAPTMVEPTTAPTTPSAARMPRTGRSLRARAGLGSKRKLLEGLEKQLESGRKKAARHFEQARKERAEGDLLRATSLVRLSVAYDPREKRYLQALEEMLPEVNASQAADAKRKGLLLLDRGRAPDALEHLEEAARLSPTDAELNSLVSRVLCETGGDAGEAIEMARRAVSLDEDNTQYRKQLGRLYKSAGRNAEARKELQRAWELDPMDKDIKAELADV